MSLAHVRLRWTVRKTHICGHLPSFIKPCRIFEIISLFSISFSEIYVLDLEGSENASHANKKFLNCCLHFSVFSSPSLRNSILFLIRIEMDFISYTQS